MLHLNELTYRLGERLLIDGATVALPTGAHVGLIGRNGAGKTTLFRLICGELAPGERGDRPAAPRPRRPGRAGGAGRRAGADRLRARRRRRTPRRCSKRPNAPTTRCASPRSRPGSSTSAPMPAPARAARILAGLGFDERGAGAAARRVLRRLAHARRACRGAVLRPRPAAARRADQLPRPRGHAVARRLSQDLSGDDPRHQPRPRPARRRRRPHRAARARQAQPVERRLHELRAAAAREPGAAGQGAQEAGGAPQASAELRRPLPRQGDQGDAGAVAPENAGQDGADRRGGRRDRRPVPLAADRQRSSARRSSRWTRSASATTTASCCRSSA